MKLEVTLEMGARGFGSANGSATTFLASQMYFDPSDYDGALFYFEVCANNGHATLPYQVDLTQGGTAVTSIILPANVAVTTRYRSTAFNPVAGNQIYMLRTPSTAAGNNVVVWACRIVVVQTNATKTRLQIPLAAVFTGSSTDTTGVQFHQSTSTTYSQSTPVNCSLFKLERALMATIAAGSPWSWETVGYRSGGTGAMIGLFDATDNVQIGAIENLHAVTNSTTIATQDFADGLLTEGNELEVRVKQVASVASANGVAARLYVRLTSVSAAAVYRLVGFSHVGPGNLLEADEARQLISTGEFSSPVVYYEGTGWESSAGTITHSLIDDGVSDSIGGGSAVAGSTLTFDGTTRIRQRTAALTLVSGDRYVPKVARTSGTLQMGPAFVIVFASVVVSSNAATIDLENIVLAAFGRGAVQLGSATIHLENVGSGDVTLAAPSGFITRPGARWLVIAEIYFDTATQYESATRIVHPTHVYTGRVFKWGSIDMSVPMPFGMPQVADGQIRVADTDRILRDLLVGETPRRRIIHLKLVQEGLSESAAPLLYNGEITWFEKGAGYVDLTFTDRLSKWLDEEITGVINRTNFPELDPGVDDAFLPIITGICVSPADNPVGVIPLPHIGLNAYGDRWGLAQHRCFELIALYRQLPDEAAYTLVAASEYVVRVEDRTIENVDYHLSFVDFIAAQPEGTLISADVHGIYERGEWNGFPELVLTDGPLRNPIDFFINMTYLILLKSGQAAEFAAGQIMLIRERLRDALIFCDGAITETMTARELLGRFLTSAGLTLSQTKAGAMTLSMPNDEDVTRPHFRQLRDVERSTFKERLADPTVNQARYQYMKNYVTGQWAKHPLYDNTVDQGALGKVETDTVFLWFVRDDTTAETVIAERLSFQALGSYRQEWVMPLPECSDVLELMRQIGITHLDGMAVGGYFNQEVIVTNLTLDLDLFRMRVKSILRVPLSLNPVVITTTCPLPTSIAGQPL